MYSLWIDNQYIASAETESEARAIAAEYLKVHTGVGMLELAHHENHSNLETVFDTIDSPYIDPYGQLLPEAPTFYYDR